MNKKEVSIQVSIKQAKWLDSHGGRNSGDVLINEKGVLYVLMGNGHNQWKKVFLPIDKSE